jgi:conjugative transposon TraN protein
MSDMKKYLLFLILAPLVSYGQKTHPVLLTFNKTVHMFFPSEISYYDVGSTDILIESKSDILKLAPKVSDFEETNLTVITSDNICYSFLLRYNKDISMLTYFIKDTVGQRINSSVRAKMFSDSIKKEESISNSESSYISVSREIIKKAPTYWIGSTMKKSYLAINNIYIHQDKLYFVMSVGNTSSINYDINYIKFYIVDKKKLKKASRQEIEKTPMFSFNNIETINAGTDDHPIIFVFEKFTIDNDKKLVIELGEKKGGRNIAIDITQDLIIKAVAFKQ